MMGFLVYLPNLEACAAPEKLKPLTFSLTTIPSPSVCSLQTIPLKYPVTTTLRSIV